MYLDKRIKYFLLRKIKIWYYECYSCEIVKKMKLDKIQKLLHLCIIKKKERRTKYVVKNNYNYYCQIQRDYIVINQD